MIENLPLMHAGWDAAVKVVQKRQARKRSPQQQPGRRPIYGMPGATAPEGRPS